jgi:hypothetical protein
MGRAVTLSCKIWVRNRQDQELKSDGDECEKRRENPYSGIFYVSLSLSLSCLSSSL